MGQILKWGSLQLCQSLMKGLYPIFWELQSTLGQSVIQLLLTPPVPI